MKAKTFCLFGKKIYKMITENIAIVCACLCIWKLGLCEAGSMRSSKFLVFNLSKNTAITNNRDELTILKMHLYPNSRHEHSKHKLKARKMFFSCCKVVKVCFCFTFSAFAFLFLLFYSITSFDFLVARNIKNGKIKAKTKIK